MIDTSKITRLIDTILLYGSPKASIWFIGLEESDPSTEESIDELIRRLALFERLGEVSLRQAIGISEYFPSKPDVLPDTQKTWYGYSKLRFAIKNIPLDVRKIRLYQGHGLGEIVNGDTCLFEFLPLPRPKHAEWAYGELSDLEFLSGNKKYLDYVSPRRIAKIIALIEQHRPEIVVFFGKTCRDCFWASFQLEKADISDGASVRPIYHGKHGGSLVVFSHHPVTPGLTTDYLQSLGLFVRERTIDN